MYGMNKKTAVDKPPFLFVLFICFWGCFQSFWFEISVYLVDFTGVGEGRVVFFEEL